MEIDVFTLCDNVQSYNGKLVITGTFNIVQGLGTLNNIGVAAVIRCKAIKEDGTHNFKIKFTDSIGRNIQNEIKGTFTTKKGDVSYINLGFNIQNVTFNTVGVYKITLEIDEIIAKQIPLMVQN